MKIHLLRIANYIHLPAITLISVVVYLLASYFTYRIGFPLDDAWIHQTYARNLGTNFEWSFQPGRSSAGSTSPLWSGLLAIGYMLEINPLFWTYLLGWIFLLSLAFLGGVFLKRLLPSPSQWHSLAGLVLTFEWHLVWASVSGMETILFSFLVLITLTWLIAGLKSWLILGAIVGLSIWVRPDGLTLVVPVFLVIFADRNTWRIRLLSIMQFLLGLVTLIIPYLLLNLSLSGSIWPNTFYAKQAEYSIELLEPFWLRLIDQFKLPLIGIGVILLPGFILFIKEATQKKAWAGLAGCAWIVGFLFLYAFRLPVTYQHGRYVIPVMPAYLLFALAGFIPWIKLNSPLFWRRVASRSVLIAGGMILLIFWGMGARAFGRDVAVIESEMVACAQWIAQNTEKDALVAAHDIGAIGYFGERSLVDLAGLISPEVIPFIRNEDQLAIFLDIQRADYLVTFPGWYPDLVTKAVEVYRTNARYAPEQGGENMSIYQWQSIAKP